MKRFIFFCILVAIVLATDIRCLKTVESDSTGSDTMLQPARCNQCHRFPGSALCDSTTQLYHSRPATLCALCHSGSVRMDSTRVPPYDSLRYHDRMISIAGTVVTALDSLHANARVDLNFRQCNSCHGYPADRGAHRYHVLKKKKQCIDCHLNTIETIRYYVANVDGTFKVAFAQRFCRGLGADSIPLPHRNRAHLNRFRGDVVIKLNAQASLTAVSDTNSVKNLIFNHDTTYNRSRNACYNIVCHSPLLPNPDHKKFEVWRVVNDSISAIGSTAQVR